MTIKVLFSSLVLLQIVNTNTAILDSGIAREAHRNVRVNFEVIKRRHLTPQFRLNLRLETDTGSVPIVDPSIVSGVRSKRQMQVCEDDQNGEKVNVIGYGQTKGCSFIIKMEITQEEAKDICDESEAFAELCPVTCNKCPSLLPSSIPSSSSKPTSTPSSMPTFKPTVTPSSILTSFPSFAPTSIPSSKPTVIPSPIITSNPSFAPTSIPSITSTSIPSFTQTSNSFSTSKSTFTPSSIPTSKPTVNPSSMSTSKPTVTPSSIPSFISTSIYSIMPTSIPSFVATYKPTFTPSSIPTSIPSIIPTSIPSLIPTLIPSFIPTSTPFSTSKPIFTHSSITSSMPSSITSFMPTSNPKQSNLLIRRVLKQFEFEISSNEKLSDDNYLAIKNITGSHLFIYFSSQPNIAHSLLEINLVLKKPSANSGRILKQNLILAFNGVAVFKDTAPTEVLIQSYQTEAFQGEQREVYLSKLKHGIVHLDSLIITSLEQNGGEKSDTSKKRNVIPILGTMLGISLAITGTMIFLLIKRKIKKRKEQQNMNSLPSYKIREDFDEVMMLSRQGSEVNKISTKYNIDDEQGSEMNKRWMNDNFDDGDDSLFDDETSTQFDDVDVVDEEIELGKTMNNLASIYDDFEDDLINMCTDCYAHTHTQ